MRYHLRAMESWAYDLDCDLDLDRLATALNQAGTWKWEARESYWHGDYLNSRPLSGLRLRIHQYPQAVGSGTLFTGPREKGFMALLEIAPESSLRRDELDPIFRALLEKVNAAIVSSLDPYA